MRYCGWPGGGEVYLVGVVSTGEEHIPPRLHAALALAPLQPQQTGVPTMVALDYVISRLFLVGGYHFSQPEQKPT